MNEPLGIFEERQANRIKYARFAYVAPHDRLPREKPVIEAEPVAVVRKSREIRRDVRIVMQRFCKVYNEVADVHLTIDDLLLERRSRDLSWPRHVCMLLVHRICGLSTTMIGKAFRRDHTTVMHALQQAPHHMIAKRALLATHDKVFASFTETADGNPPGDGTGTLAASRAGSAVAASDGDPQ